YPQSSRFCRELPGVGGAVEVVLLPRAAARRPRRPPIQLSPAEICHDRQEETRLVPPALDCEKEDAGPAAGLVTTGVRVVARRGGTGRRRAAEVQRAGCRRPGAVRERPTDELPGVDRPDGRQGLLDFAQGQDAVVHVVRRPRARGATEG